MPSSTLDSDVPLGPDRKLGRGHGADALGPSDLSDTGSDVQGGMHAVDEDLLDLDKGTNEDADVHNLSASEESVDAGGTGETSTAGRNNDVELSGDIGFDRIESINPDNDDIDDDDTDAGDAGTKAPLH